MKRIIVILTAIIVASISAFAQNQVNFNRLEIKGEYGVNAMEYRLDTAKHGEDSYGSLAGTVYFAPFTKKNPETSVAGLGAFFDYSQSYSIFDTSDVERSRWSAGLAFRYSTLNSGLFSSGYNLDFTLKAGYFQKDQLSEKYYYLEENPDSLVGSYNRSIKTSGFKLAGEINFRKDKPDNLDRSQRWLSLVKLQGSLLSRYSTYGVTKKDDKVANHQFDAEDSTKTFYDASLRIDPYVIPIKSKVGIVPVSLTVGSTNLVNNVVFAETMYVEAGIRIISLQRAEDVLSIGATYMVNNHLASKYPGFRVSVNLLGLMDCFANRK